MKELVIEGEKSLEIKKKVNEIVGFCNDLDKKMAELLDTASVKAEVAELKAAIEGLRKMQDQIFVSLEEITGIVTKPEPEIRTAYNPPPEDPEAFNIEGWSPIAEGDKFWKINGYVTAVSHVPVQVLEQFKELKNGTNKGS